MKRTVLLKGEVPIRREELDRLRRRDAELQDYMAAIKSPKVQAIRRRAMSIRRTPVGRALAALSGANVAWAQGVADYESALEEALLDELRRRT